MKTSIRIGIKIGFLCMESTALGIRTVRTGLMSMGNIRDVIFDGVYIHGSKHHGRHQKLVSELNSGICDGPSGNGVMEETYGINGNDDYGCMDSRSLWL
jgi:hypothetical protein